MSGSLAIFHDLIRACLTAAVVLIPSIGCSSLLKGRKQDWLTVLLFLPFFTPMVLIGWATKGVWITLLEAPLISEALYCGILVCKFVPLAVLVQLCAPEGLSREARFTLKLAEGLSWPRRLTFYLLQPTPAWALAYALSFLFIFSEFELASLMGIPSWSVALFDAQVQGFTTVASLILARNPLLVQLAVVVFLFSRIQLTRGDGSGVSTKASPGWGVKVYATVAAVFLTILPILNLITWAWDGIIPLFSRFALGLDILASVGFAFAAALLALLAARTLSNIRQRWVLAMVCLPGLLGALLLSLVVITLFQQPGLNHFYESPVPLILALTLMLIPFSLMLTLLLKSWEHSDQLMSARLLEAGPCSHQRQAGAVLRHSLLGGRRMLVFFLLFVTAYLDFTAGSLLAPARMPTVFSRLYNFLHYGQSALLAAQLLTAFLIPLVLLMGLLIASRWRGSIGRLTHG